MKYVRGARGLALCGSALTAVAVLVTLNTTTASVSSVPEGLKGLSITPSDDATVPVGGSIRLSAEGDYGTRSMPVRADWSFVKGEGLGSLKSCANAKTCTFTAGDAAGAVTVQAQVGNGTFSDTVNIVVQPKEEDLANPFKDELPEWALRPIVRMFKKLIVKGYDDGRYGPGDSVTNGQVITLLERILKHAKLIGEPGKCEQVYDDVPQGHYAFKPACLFHAQGWSMKDGLLQPDAPASRGATAGFINRVVGSTILGATGAKSSQEEAFDDVPADHPRFADVAVTSQIGIMTGYPTGDFGVNDDLNRAAAAVIMSRVLEKVETLGITALQGYDSSKDKKQDASSSASSEVSSSVTVSSPSVASSIAPESSSVSSPALSSSSQEAPKPAAPSVDVRARGEIQTITFGTKEIPFDFSENKVDDRSHDAYLEPVPASQMIVLQDHGFLTRERSVFVLLNRGVTFKDVTYADCVYNLKEGDTQKGVSLVEDFVVCIRTSDGKIVKLGDPIFAPAVTAKYQVFSDVEGKEGPGAVDIDGYQAFFDFSSRTYGSYEKPYSYDVEFLIDRTQNDIEIRTSGANSVFGDGMYLEYGMTTGNDCLNAVRIPGGGIVRILSPLNPFGQCLKTSDGFIVKLGKASISNNGGSVQFEVWNKDSAALSAPTSSSVASVPVVSSSSSSVRSVAVEETPAHTEKGKIFLWDTDYKETPTRWYDFSEFTYKKDENDLPYDLFFGWNAKQKSMYVSPQNGKSKIVVSTKDAGALTYATCQQDLLLTDYAPGEAIVGDYGPICFETADGYIGALTNAKSSLTLNSGEVAFTLWRKGATKAPAKELNVCSNVSCKDTEQCGEGICVVQECNKPGENECSQREVCSGTEKMAMMHGRPAACCVGTCKEAPGTPHASGQSEVTVPVDTAAVCYDISAGKVVQAGDPNCDLTVDRDYGTAKPGSGIKIVFSRENGGMGGIRILGGFTEITYGDCVKALNGYGGEEKVNVASAYAFSCYKTRDGIIGKMGRTDADAQARQLRFVRWTDSGSAGVVSSSSQQSSPVSVVSVSSVPASSTPVSSVQKKVSGSCILRAGNAPRGDAPDTGTDYVKKHIPGVNDIDGLRTACTQNVFDALLKEYCALGVSPSVQRGVLTFRDDYSISSSGCGSMGCEYATCPVTVNTDDLLYAGGIEINQNPLFIDLLTGKGIHGAPDSTHDISAQTVVTFSQSCRRTGGLIKRTRCTTSAQTNFSAQKSGGSKVVVLNPQKPFEQVTAADCKASIAKGGADAPIVFGVNSSPSLVVLCVNTNDGNTAALGKFTDTYAQFKTWKR